MSGLLFGLAIITVFILGTVCLLVARFRKRKGGTKKDRQISVYRASRFFVLSVVYLISAALLYFVIVFIRDISNLYTACSTAEGVEFFTLLLSGVATVIEGKSCYYGDHTNMVRRRFYINSTKILLILVAVFCLIAIFIDL